MQLACDQDCIFRDRGWDETWKFGDRDSQKWVSRHRH